MENPFTVLSLVASLLEQQGIMKINIIGGRRTDILVCPYYYGKQTGRNACPTK